jgi:hypothetical protein
MFKNFPQSDLTLVSTAGLEAKLKGIVAEDQIVVPDVSASIDIGDEIRRSLPNGKDETFEVMDPVFQEAFGGIPAHYQVKVRKKGLLPTGSGGNYTINVSGSNSRVNIHSQDNSRNFANDLKVFEDARAAVLAHLPDNDQRAQIVRALDAAKAATGDPDSYRAAYQKLISSAADHMTVLAPFLPMLTSFLG